MVCASDLKIEWGDSGIGGGNVGVEIGLCDILRESLALLLRRY